MQTKGMFLSWIVVKDIKAAIRFYTEVVGLKLKELNEDFGWAELTGPEGSFLGLAQENEAHGLKAGSNAVITVFVQDIACAVQDFKAKGANLIREVIEIPDHVKMQTFQDRDGNTLQLVEDLSSSS